MSRSFKITGMDKPANWKHHPTKGDVCAVCGGPLTSWYHSAGRDICLSCVLKQSTISAAKVLKKQSTGMTELLAHLKPSCEITERLGYVGCQNSIANLMQNSVEMERRTVVHAAALQLGERSEHPLAGILKLRTMVLLMRESLFCFETFEDVVHQILSSELCDDPDEFSRLSSIVLLYLCGFSERNEQLLRHEQQLIDTWHTHVYSLLVREWRGALLPRLPRSIALRWLDICSARYGKEQELLSCAILDESISDFITSSLDRGYSSVELAVIYQRYIKPIIPQLKKYIPKLAHLPKNLNKNHYLNMLSQVLIQPEPCSLFFAKMERFIREGLFLMVRTGKTVDIEYMKALGMRETFTKGVRFTGDIYKAFPLFESLSTYYYDSKVLDATRFYVSGVCAEVFSIFIPSGQPALIYQLPDPSWRIAEMPEAAASIMHMIEYIDHIGLTLSKNGQKVTKSSLKALRAAAGVNEPYPDIARLNTLRTSLMADMLEGGVFSHPSVTGNDLVKLIFSLFFSFDAMEYFRTELMLSHLNISDPGGVDRERMRIERSALRILLRSMEVGKWVTFDTLFDALADGCLLPRVLDPYEADVDASFTALGSGYSSYRNEKHTVTMANYTDVVLIPYVKLLLFLLNTFGAVDLAMGDPVNPVYHPLSRDYLSDYDGVQACALTPFGAWLLGTVEHCAVEVAAETGTIHLNEHQLYAVIEGNLPVAEVVLQTMAKKTGDRLYHFTVDSFLQECGSLKDIEQKINTFAQVVSNDPPQLWKTFLANLQDRGGALTADHTSYITFTVTECGPELIRILTEDSFLSQEVIKAEGFRILIPRTSYPKVRTRMRTYGYLLPELKSGGRPKRTR